MLSSAAADANACLIAAAPELLAACPPEALDALTALLSEIEDRHLWHGSADPQAFLDRFNRVKGMNFSLGTAADQARGEEAP